jgi:hypothetical protein
MNITPPVKSQKKVSRKWLTHDMCMFLHQGISDRFISFTLTIVP